MCFEGKSWWVTFGGTSAALILVSTLIFAHLCLIIVIHMTALPGTWLGFHDHRQLIHTFNSGFQFVLLSVCIAASILLGEMVVRATCCWRRSVTSTRWLSSPTTPPRGAKAPHTEGPGHTRDTHAGHTHDTRARGYLSYVFPLSLSLSLSLSLTHTHTQVLESRHTLLEMAHHPCPPSKMGDRAKHSH